MAAMAFVFIKKAAIAFVFIKKAAIAFVFIKLCGWEGVMVFNATFNTISVISWWSVLLVEETVVPGENHRSVATH